MDKHVDENIRAKLQDRLLQCSINETVRMGLFNFMNAAMIDDFASENPVGVPVTETTLTMIFIMIRLFSNVHSRANKSSMIPYHTISYLINCDGHL
jgi:hypothetical protein